MNTSSPPLPPDADPRRAAPPSDPPPDTFGGQAARYKLLLELNNAVISQTTPEGLFQGLAREIHRIVHFDRFSICIYDADSMSLGWFAMAEGISVRSMDMGPRPLEKGPIAQAVITSRRPLIIPDMSLFLHWDTVRLMMEAGLRATMCFPLIARGHVLGSLHFSFKSPPPDMDDLAVFLSELSGQVAVAVDNMLVHAKLVDLNSRLEQQKSYLIRQVTPQYDPRGFVWESPVMREIMRQVEIVAQSDASVLITGETGTGKDHIAHYIHTLSPRREALFVKINCPALMPSLFESELFGHAKGAFTGAGAKRAGRFEMAGGGTVFLDEIGELPLPLQAKLLHVLQDGRFERVGDSQPIDVDFRVIAATNVDLQKALADNTFRQDLYYRLNTVSFHLPPLRERPEEIEPLARSLLQMQSKRLNRTPPTFSPQAGEALKRHSWPGNVRELRNILNRLLIVHSGKTVTLRDIESLLGKPRPAPQQPLMSLAEAERAYLIKVLALCKGAVGGRNGAATLLKVPKSTLQYRLRKHGIDPKDYLA